MGSLLSIIEKLHTHEDYLVKSSELNENLLHRVLKWYDGNVYNRSNERVSNALNILEWCYYRAADLEYLPRDIRDNYFENAGETFKISHEKLDKLFITHSKLLFPKQNETKIIAFEGIDGSGKTVQMSLIEEYLKSNEKQVAIRSFPVYDSFFGSHIGNFLSGNDKLNANNVDPKSMSLWYALDRWKAFENFNYNNYDYLLLNRFTLSSAVYQSSRVGPEHRSEFVQWIFELEHSQLGLPAPDLYIVFDLNAETSRKNISNKGFRNYVGEKPDVYEDSTDIMKNARNIYQELADQYKNIVIIECMDENHNMKSPQEINKMVMRVLEDGKY